MAEPVPEIVSVFEGLTAGSTLLIDVPGAGPLVTEPLKIIGVLVEAIVLLAEITILLATAAVRAAVSESVPPLRSSVVALLPRAVALPRFSVPAVSR